MRRALAGAAAAAVTLPLLTGAAWTREPPSPASRADHEVLSAVAAMGPDDTATVLVTLREQADLSTVPGRGRGARLRATVAALQATASASQGPLNALLRSRAAQGEVVRSTPLWVVNGISVTATADVIRELASDPRVASVSSDVAQVVPAYGTPEPNQSAINAPALWDLGQTGQGVVVASLDSGVDVSHPDLAGRWRGGSNSWFDPYGQHATPTDLTGHGTATMGVLVGGDSGGTSVGTAPGASWIAAKIFNDSGSATVTAIHQAFQWVLDPDHDPLTADAPSVVNNSWSLGTAPGCDLTFQPDLQALRAAGILPVFAAGNFGPGSGTSVSPANYPEALSVGAVNAQSAAYTSSSRGPSTCGGRSRVFPDLVAPGVSVTTTDRYGLYQVASGTSVAAPHAAGALALLLGARPGLSADAQQSLLVDSAVDLGTVGPDPTFGNGRLDVLAAFQSLPDPPDFSVAATPSSRTVRAGGKRRYTVEVTPTNGFSQTVSLSASGLPTGVGTATVTPSAVSGGGSALLKVATVVGAPKGTYPIEVAASSGGTVHTTTVTLRVRNPDFTVSISPLRARAVRGRAALFDVAVSPVDGFHATVRLSRSGLPGGVTTTWSPKLVTVGGTSALRVKTSRATPRGRHHFLVVGTSGTLRHTVDAVLRVR